jgi:hypothetical protein
MPGCYAVPSAGFRKRHLKSKLTSEDHRSPTASGNGFDGSGRCCRDLADQRRTSGPVDRLEQSDAYPWLG